MNDLSQHPVIDIPNAIKLAGGKADLAKDLFQMLINSLPETQAKITQQVTAGAADLLFQEIHRLQGACRYCGVPALLAACQQAEAHVKSHGVANVQPLIDTLNEQIAALEQWATQNTWQAP